MNTHFHLLVTPANETALSVSMGRSGSQYVKRFNRKYGRFGTLWADRYRGIPIGDERYWLTCLRYIDLNPVAANIVADPEAYPWSTYRLHARGDDSYDWVTPHSIYQALGEDDSARQAAFRSMCAQPIDPMFLAKQRVARQDTPMSLTAAA